MTTETLPQTDKLPRPRRWIPLSLRIFVAALAIVGTFGIWILAVRGYRTQEVISETQRVGGRCRREPRGPDLLRWLVGDDWMVSFDEITAVDLRDSRMTDAGLE